MPKFERYLVEVHRPHNGRQRTGIAVLGTLSLFLALVLVAAKAPPAYGAAFTVDSAADLPDLNPGDGLCRAANGACTLRAAIQEANARQGPHSIALPPATFTLSRFGPSEDGAVSGDLDIKSNVTLKGGAAIQGGAGWNDRVFDVQAGADATLAGLTITGGRSPDGTIVGVGLRNRGILRLTDVIVSGNSNVSPAATVFSSGGGIANLDGGTLTLGASTVSGNAAGNTGGGIFNGSGSVTLSGTTVRGNTADADGAGIFSYSGTLTLTDSTVTDNRSLLSYGDGGGGIGNYGTAAVTGSSIGSNFSQVRGGGISNRGVMTLAKSTISGNESLTGGGIANVGSFTATDVTISGNTALFDGGGIANRFLSDTSFGTVTATNLTITNNVAGTDLLQSGDGGGVFNGAGAAFSVSNTILAGNRDESRLAYRVDDKRPDCAGALTSNGYNLIFDTTGCAIGGFLTGNIIGASAKLGPLQDNGGLTFTHSLTSVPPLGLPELSSAVDRGSPATPGSGGSACADSTDQRGLARPVDGNGDGIARCDIGAFEYHGLPFKLGTFALAPEDAVVEVKEHLRYSFAWTVPGPGWRTLDTLDLRIRNDEGVALWVQFKELAGTPGTFSLVDPSTGEAGPSFAPGSRKQLKTEAAVLHLAGSRVDGPPGSRVTLTLELSFKREAAGRNGRSYDVEVLAVNDAGEAQGFAPAGRLTVQRDTDTREGSER